MAGFGIKWIQQGSEVAAREDGFRKGRGLGQEQAGSRHLGKLNELGQPLRIGGLIPNSQWRVMVRVLQ